MDYLNEFNISTIALEDIDSYKKLKRYIQIETLIEEHDKDKSVRTLKPFDADRVVLNAPEVYIEVLDYKDDIIMEKFKADGLPGLTSMNFTAGEMFYNILMLENKVNGDTSQFEKIEFIDYLNNIPIYRAYFF